MLSIGFLDRTASRVMTWTEEQVLWGAAAMLVRRHGEEARSLVVERLRLAELEDDELTCALWSAIAQRVDDLSASLTEQ